MLDSIGAKDVGFGDDVPYNEDAWERVARGERPEGDDLAEGFFHLARVEEMKAGPRDEHGRFRGEWSCLDPFDPPLERLRRRLGVAADAEARFTVALTHDVDMPWRWTRIGLRGAAARLKENVRHARLGPTVREATGLATAPVHLARGTDPNWRFEQIVADERRRGASGSTFYVIASHHDPHDGAAPEEYSRLRPRLVETLLDAGAEVGLHGSYAAADDPVRLAAEKQKLDRVRIDPAFRLTTGAISEEISRADLVQYGFADDRARGISSAEEEHVIRTISHDAPLRCAAGRGSGSRSDCGLRCAAGTLFLMCHACRVLARAIAIGDALARCQERFPCDASRIHFSLGVVNGSSALFE